jgi:hypothetical protein
MTRGEDRVGREERGREGRVVEGGGAALKGVVRWGERRRLGAEGGGWVQQQAYGSEYLIIQSGSLDNKSCS